MVDSAAAAALPAMALMAFYANDNRDMDLLQVHLTHSYQVRKDSFDSQHAHHP